MDSERDRTISDYLFLRGVDFLEGRTTLSADDPVLALQVEKARETVANERSEEERDAYLVRLETEQIALLQQGRILEREVCELGGTTEDEAAQQIAEIDAEVERLAASIFRLQDDPDALGREERKRRLDALEDGLSKQMAQEKERPKENAGTFMNGVMWCLASIFTSKPRS